MAETTTGTTTRWFGSLARTPEERLGEIIDAALDRMTPEQADRAIESSQRTLDEWRKRRKGQA